jgi:hypothetical protein
MFSRSLISAVAVLSAAVPTLEDTETDVRSPNDFPTMNFGSTVFVVEEKPGSMANRSSPTTARIPSSTPPLYGPSATEAAAADPTVPSCPAISFVLTPSERRAMMSFFPSGGSEKKSTSYFSSVPVTVTVTVTYPFFVSARASRRGLFLRGSWKSIVTCFRSYRLPPYSTFPSTTSKDPRMITRLLSPTIRNSPFTTASARLFRIRIVSSAMALMSNRMRNADFSRRAETSVSRLPKSTSAFSGRKVFT